MTIKSCPCGDGNLDNGEECDDGDLDDTNGCTNNCKASIGYSCNPQGVCTPICGDQKKYGNEVCDDNNINDGGGCKPDCSGALPGFYCSGGSTTGPDTCTI